MIMDQYSWNWSFWKRVFSNPSQLFLVCLVLFDWVFYSKGCCYHCHAGEETSKVSLASLWDLWQGVWARGSMVSQVSSLLVCARKDPRRRIQEVDVNKKHDRDEGLGGNCMTIAASTVPVKDFLFLCRFFGMSRSVSIFLGGACCLWLLSFVDKLAYFYFIKFIFLIVLQSWRQGWSHQTQDVAVHRSIKGSR